LQLVVIPGDRRIAGQVHDVFLVIAWNADAVIEDGGEQDDAVHLHAAILQGMYETRAAQGAVAFAKDEFGRVPAFVDGDIALDGAGKEVDVLIDAPKILAGGLAQRTRETCAHHVDKYKVGLVNQAVRIFADIERRGRGDLVGRGIHAHRAKRADMQPHAG